MTYILVGLMFFNGQLHYAFSIQESKKACIEAVRAIKDVSENATVFCVAVLGQPA